MTGRSKAIEFFSNYIEEFADNLDKGVKNSDLITLSHMRGAINLINADINLKESTK